MTSKAVFSEATEKQDLLLRVQGQHRGVLEANDPERIYLLSVFIFIHGKKDASAP